MGIGPILVLAGPATAEAAQAHSFADEQISQSYSIPVTNPLTKINLPSILLVASAHIDTSRPDESGVQAPKGLGASDRGVGRAVPQGVAGGPARPQGTTGSLEGEQAP